MAQNYVTELVKECLVWELRKRVNCDLTLARKALHISVRVVEWNARNTKSGKRSLGVPLRDYNWCKFLSVSLAENKPTGLINKAGKGVFVVCVFLTAFASDRHAQSECSFATLHKAG
jgi:hypothetical protein